MFNVCTFEGCELPVRCKSLCRKHYHRLWAHGDPAICIKDRERVCAIDGCGGKHKAKGLCSKHYCRFTRFGDFDGARTSPESVRSFIESAVGSATDECINWPFAKYPSGYGKATVDGRSISASRLILSLVSGWPVNTELECCHAPVICHNRGCVNPRHLRWGTRQDNIADRILDGTNRKRKTRELTHV